MQVIFIDYETFYSNEYSLRKMTPVEYVLDPRFECIGAAIKEGHNGEAYWVDGDDLPHFFADLDPDKTAMVSHNALFDACITSWRYNFRPAFTIDTLGIARATLGYKLKSLSLASVANELGIGVKGGTVHKVIGMGAAAIKQAGLYDEYIQYAINDVELCAGIYDKLVRSGLFPARELKVMDMVLRCATEPQFYLDQNVLALHLHSIKTQKDQLLAVALMGASINSKDDLMSNEKFAQALRVLGVEPPMKTSLVTGKPSYAFAKTDPQFMELEEHDNPMVQALVAARLGHKSTLEETRTQKFLTIANLQWPDTSQGKVPMPLRYSGAHTHRLSGEWSINVQNMPRGGALRRAIIAPPGHQVLQTDASQIEARMVAWICGQTDLVQQFENKEDVYSSFASKVFGFAVNKKDHPAERFIGKTAILGLGYGLGWEKFQRTVKMQSKAQAGRLIELSDPEAMKIISTYRDGYAAIPATWRVLNSNIDVLANGGHFKFGPCIFEKGSILLPSGLRLNYHNLRYEDGGWVYEFAGKPKRLYGGALLENIVQALARIVVMDAAVRIEKLFATYGVQLALQVHDELVFCVPDELVTVCRQILLEEMRRRPTWAPSLPLDAESDAGPNYGDAK